MKRYVTAMIRDAKTTEGLTEENFKVICIFFQYLILKCIHSFHWCVNAAVVMYSSQQLIGAQAGYLQFPL